MFLSDCDFIQVFAGFLLSGGGRKVCSSCGLSTTTLGRITHINTHHLKLSTGGVIYIQQICEYWGIILPFRLLWASWSVMKLTSFWVVCSCRPVLIICRHTKSNIRPIRSRFKTLVTLAFFHIHKYLKEYHDPALFWNEMIPLKWNDTHFRFKF